MEGERDAQVGLLFLLSIMLMSVYSTILCNYYYFLKPIFARIFKISYSIFNTFTGMTIPFHVKYGNICFLVPSMIKRCPYILCRTSRRCSLFKRRREQIPVRCSYLSTFVFQRDFIPLIREYPSRLQLFGHVAGGALLDGDIPAAFAHLNTGILAAGTHGFHFRLPFEVGGAALPVCANATRCLGHDFKFFC